MRPIIIIMTLNKSQLEIFTQGLYLVSTYMIIFTPYYILHIPIVGKSLNNKSVNMVLSIYSTHK